MISKDRAAKLFTYFMRSMEEQEKTNKDKKKGTINRSERKRARDEESEDLDINNLIDLTLDEQNETDDSDSRTSPTNQKENQDSDDDSTIYDYPETYALRTGDTLDEQSEESDKQSVKYSADVIVQIEDRNGATATIRALLDTGTTQSIILRDFVRKGRAQSYKGKKTVWRTLGGEFTTNRKALIDFSFPELSDQRNVTWVCHVDAKTDPKTARYDMIVGLDLMTEIGIYVDTDEKLIKWKGQSTPLKKLGTLQDPDVRNELFHLVANELSSTVLSEAEARQDRILDADYSAVDLDSYVAELQHLTITEQSQLLTVLRGHSTLFSGFPCRSGSCG